MFQCKTKAALRLITEQNVGSMLHLDSNIDSSAEDAQCTVRDALLSKHPPGQLVSTNALYSTATEPSVTTSSCATTLKTAASRTDGAAGPSGIDVRG